MKRVRALNADGGYLYRVNRVVLFGSFLTEAPTFGDVDLAFDLTRREPDGEKFNAQCDARVRRAQEEGRIFRTYASAFCFPYDEVFRFLRARTRYLSFHALSEVQGLGCPTRTLDIGTPQSEESITSSHPSRAP